jgi:hypothetical protein
VSEAPQLGDLAKLIKAKIEQDRRHRVTVDRLPDGDWCAYLTVAGDTTIGRGKSDREALVDLAAMVGVELGEK